jgi:hypothetical protein
VPEATARITLPDRYRVVRHIANGGMASVWEAHDDLLDRPVAVKLLAAHLSEDERAHRRFQREARAAAGLSSHPHVVTIYDVAEHDGRTFIVMELLRGGTVADRLRSGRAIPHRAALRWLREAGEALDAAHEAGIVHRDVKPANMLLDNRDRLALADFGIARLALEDQITQTGQVLGTAAYISPEQAMGEPSTPASDRYALAVVAYELLTGTRPFEAQNFAAQARAHVEDDPEPASARDLDVPPAADLVLARGMAKEPGERWESAGAMVRALDDALAPPPRRRAATSDATRVMGEPLPSRATPSPAPGRETRRAERAAAGAPPRRFGASAVIALAALLLVAAGAVALITAGGGGSDGQRASTPPKRTATPTKSATAEPTKTATATPTATATASPEPTAAATEPAVQPDDQQGKDKPKLVKGGDAAALQLQAYRLNSAGKPAEALPYAERAVKLCVGSTQVSPCGYALFEYAKALRLTGNPSAAIQVLEERKQRFPGNQPSAVEHELALAKQAAGQG